MLRINSALRVLDLAQPLEELWQVSGGKIRSIQETFDFSKGSPVFTVNGTYTARGWTDWTLGFHFGSAFLDFESTGDDGLLELGRAGLSRMEAHLTHMGVHDHGFNTVSSFGNLRRLILEGRVASNRDEMRYLELAIKCSAAVQAHRWTPISDGGFIYSFNGPHSLFSDTIRSLRVLALGHQIGHVLFEENDTPVFLLERLVQHARSTARFNVFYGRGADAYDIRGRVAHESLFNIRDGAYRCPSTQQGYSPRSTWTRGLAWIMLGFAEQLEFVETVQGTDLDRMGGREEIRGWMVEAARSSSDFYIETCPTNGIPYWDTGAPGLSQLGDYLNSPADPFNDYEPVDSSAAAIAAQGLLRLGHYLKERDLPEGDRYWQAGLTTAAALLNDPYLSRDPSHQGLLLHSIYHRPNGWDHVPAGRLVPCGESSMWGDYHLRELALYLNRLLKGDPYLTFWSGQEVSE